MSPRLRVLGLLVVTATLGVAGCGSDEDSTTTSSEPATEATTTSTSTTDTTTTDTGTTDTEATSPPTVTSPAEELHLGDLPDCRDEPPPCYDAERGVGVGEDGTIYVPE